MSFSMNFLLSYCPADLSLQSDLFMLFIFSNLIHILLNLPNIFTATKILKSLTKDCVLFSIWLNHYRVDTIDRIYTIDSSCTKLGNGRSALNDEFIKQDSRFPFYLHSYDLIMLLFFNKW